MRGQGGFTLLEVLFALAIAGVAIGIFVNLFFVSHSQFLTNRHREAALSYAQQQLDEIKRDPGKFAWPAPSEIVEGARLPITLKDSAAEQRFTVPAVLANVKRDVDGRDLRRLISDLRWKAYVSPSATPNTSHYDLVIEMRWTDTLGQQVETLTTIVPKSILETNG